MSVPSHADVIVLNHRPGPALRPGDLMLERRPLRPPGPGEAVVRNLITSVDPYQLRMLRGSPEVTPVAIGEPVPANSVGIVVASEDPAVPVGAQVATYPGWQSYATTTIAPTEIADPALGGPLECRHRRRGRRGGPARQGRGRARRGHRGRQGSHRSRPAGAGRRHRGRLPRSCVPGAS